MSVPDQPDGIQAQYTDDDRVPAPAAAADRVKSFVSWFGDGLIPVETIMPTEPAPPLYARDLCSLVCAVEHGFAPTRPARCLHVRPEPTRAEVQVVRVLADAAMLKPFERRALRAAADALAAQMRQPIGRDRLAGAAHYAEAVVYPERALRSDEQRGGPLISQDDVRWLAAALAALRIPTEEVP